MFSTEKTKMIGLSYQESMMIRPAVSIRYRNVTDRQTERRNRASVCKHFSYSDKPFNAVANLL